MESLQDMMDRVKMNAYNKKQEAKEAVKKEEPKTKIEKSTEHFNDVFGEYVPEQAAPATKKESSTFWSAFDENDESGQLKNI